MQMRRSSAGRSLLFCPYRALVRIARSYPGRRSHELALGFLNDPLRGMARLTRSRSSIRQRPRRVGIELRHLAGDFGRVRSEVFFENRSVTVDDECVSACNQIFRWECDETVA